MPSTIARWVLPLALGACGGSEKPPPKKPVVEPEAPKPPPVETEADREAKRKAAALAIVPEGSTCFPPALKKATGARLELAAINNQAVVCATDIDRETLLGPLACWEIDIGDGSLTYQAAAMIPGRNVTVKLDDRCARGFCIPKDAKRPDDGIVHMATSPDRSKVVVVAGDDAHVFDATSRSRESGFSIRGDNGVTNTPSAVHWVGGTIFIEGQDRYIVSSISSFTSDF